MEKGRYLILSRSETIVECCRDILYGCAFRWVVCEECAEAGRIIKGHCNCCENTGREVGNKPVALATRAAMNDGYHVFCLSRDLVMGTRRDGSDVRLSDIFRNIKSLFHMNYHWFPHVYDKK